MSKQEFLERLRTGLAGLPQEDIEERLTFYSEMIDDRIEEGLSESEAVSQLGPAEELALQIISETPLSKLVKEKVKQKRSLRAWEAVLLILGFPIWLPLLIAAFSVVLSLYIILWSLVISLWAIWVSFVVCGLGGIAAAVIFALNGSGALALITLGAGLFFAGLSVFMFFGSRAASKGMISLTVRSASGIKTMFIVKGGKNE